MSGDLQHLPVRVKLAETHKETSNLSTVVLNTSPKIVKYIL